MWTAGLAELSEAAGRTSKGARAAALLPTHAAAELRALVRLERVLRGIPQAAPHDLSGAASALVDAGGKRVRPLMLLLSARAAARGGRAPGRSALALVAELVHSASLLHDDVIDDGLTRRGLPAPRVRFGNSVSVIAGDWMLTASLTLAQRSGVPGAVEALVRALHALVEGEAIQLRLRGSIHFTVQHALQVARGKTGSLFAFCGEAGALAARATPEVREGLRSFGAHAGTAFQIADDLLDVEGEEAALGKAVLADAAEGKPSLPLAVALERDPALRDELAMLLTARDAGQDDLPRTLRLAVRMRQLGALDEARRVAEAEREASLSALRCLPPTRTRDLLEVVASSLVSRKV
jgi:octaprenyl-diphosphate synthase